MQPVTLTAGHATGELETVLAAWHTATLRLEQTHEALRAEVRRLTDELEIKNRELARKNRLADLGQIAAHVAHEVRNNLVPLKLYLGLLRRRLTPDPGALDVLTKVEGAVTSLDATVNDLLHFTSDREPRETPVELAQLVDEVIASLGPQLEAQAIEVIVDVPPSLQWPADRDMLRRALVNLALNALDAMPRGGELVMTVHAGRHGCEIEVADSGPGFSDDAIRRACEPFFTTKAGGTGLGLAIVYRIAEVHGGTVTVANCPEGGAAVTLVLPRKAWEAAA